MYAYTVTPGTSPPRKPYCLATSSEWMRLSDAVAALCALTVYFVLNGVPSRAQVADEVVGPQRHEGLHHIGVELRPGVAADLLSRLVGGHGPAVGAVGDHRVEGIGDGED